MTMSSRFWDCFNSRHPSPSTKLISCACFLHMRRFRLSENTMSTQTHNTITITCLSLKHARPVHWMDIILHLRLLLSTGNMSHIVPQKHCYYLTFGLLESGDPIAETYRQLLLLFSHQPRKERISENSSLTNKQSAHWEGAFKNVAASSCILYLLYCTACLALQIHESNAFDDALILVSNILKYLPIWTVYIIYVWS